MLKNNIEVDVKVKCIENGITQAQLAEKSETSSPYVNRIIKKSEVLNKTFVRMMEELGYDIELTYVKRTEYSCAITPQVRQAGNRLSGLTETAYASLLA